MKTLTVLFNLCFLGLTITLPAQTGLINHVFSGSNDYGWDAATTGVTSNSTATLTGGKMVVSLVEQALGDYRGDFKRFTNTTVHAGNYPIFAIKFNKPPHSRLFFDTNLGSYNNRNDNQFVMKTSDGSRVFYWDMSALPFGNPATWLSTTSPTTLTAITLKVGSVIPTPEQVAANVYNYDIDWIKTFPSVAALRATVTSPFPTTNFNFSGTFTHPGALHNAADLARLRDYVNRQVGLPYQCYLNFRNSGYAKYTYAMNGPYAFLSRDATESVLNTRTGLYETNIKVRCERDCLAAYYNALMWHISGDVRHAQEAEEILNGYGQSLTGIVGADAALNGLQGFMLANAGELLRGYSAWSSAEQTTFGNMLKTVFYPVLENFVPCANSNWDLIAMKCLMAIAIFTEDYTMFNKVGNYFYNGEGNGSLYNHIVSASGQLQESSRDQGHTQLSLGARGDICEMAWKQGLDLYAANNNALMKGTEYTASYNLGNTVPFERHLDYCLRLQPSGALLNISNIGRGSFSVIYEQIYNHYVYRKGVSMPFTFQHLSSLNATGGEGAGNPNSVADYSGYGSFLFYLASTPTHTGSVLTQLQTFAGFENGKTNRLEWSTTSEQNNVRFKIERSADAKTFSEIGSVKGNGTTSTLSHYNFDDLDPLSIGYYRLVQIDNDGKMTYSKIISINRETTKAIKVTRSISNQFLTIEMPENTDATYFISNVLGQVVASGKLPQTTLVELPIGHFTTGMYILKITTSKQKSLAYKFVSP